MSTFREDVEAAGMASGQDLEQREHGAQGFHPGMIIEHDVHACANLSGILPESRLKINLAKQDAGEAPLVQVRHDAGGIEIGEITHIERERELKKRAR